jgi:hypothetical protein
MTARHALSLRAALASHEPGRGKRYSPALKARIIEFGRSRRAEGVSWAQVASEIGICSQHGSATEPVGRILSCAPSLSAVGTGSQTVGLAPSQPASMASCRSIANAPVRRPASVRRMHRPGRATELRPHASPRALRPRAYPRGDTIAPPSRDCRSDASSSWLASAASGGGNHHPGLH